LSWEGSEGGVDKPLLEEDTFIKIFDVKILLVVLIEFLVIDNDVVVAEDIVLVIAHLEEPLLYHLIKVPLELLRDV
jgi:hypothetical protein